MVGFENPFCHPSPSLNRPHRRRRCLIGRIICLLENCFQSLPKARGPIPVCLPLYDP